VKLRGGLHAFNSRGRLYGHAIQFAGFQRWL